MSRDDSRSSEPGGHFSAEPGGHFIWVREGAKRPLTLQEGCGTIVVADGSDLGSSNSQLDGSTSESCSFSKLRDLEGSQSAGQGANHQVWENVSDVGLAQGEEEDADTQGSGGQEEDEDDDEDVADASVFSVGSVGHPDGTCRPCVFVTTKNGCRNGRNCQFCHMPHAPKKKASKAGKRSRDRYRQFVSEMRTRIEMDPSEADLDNASVPGFVARNPVLKSKMMSRLSEHATQIRSQNAEEQDQQVPVFGVQGGRTDGRRRHIVAL